jgi:hypothetical protein
MARAMLAAAIGLLVGAMGCAAGTESEESEDELATLRINLVNADSFGARSLRIRGIRRDSEYGDVVDDKYPCRETFNECVNIGAEGVDEAVIGNLCPSKDVPYRLWDFSFVFSSNCDCAGDELNPISANVAAGSDPTPFGFACYDLSSPTWETRPNEAVGVELAPGCSESLILCVKDPL